MQSPIISWNDDWLMHIPEIDTDHKKLVGIMQKLLGSLLSNSHGKEINDIYKELLDYTMYHFKKEEAFFEEIGYPNIDVHKHLHSDLFLSVADNYNSAIEDPDKVKKGSELYEFLNTWMVKHILEEDMKFREFYRSVT